MRTRNIAIDFGSSRTKVSYFDDNEKKARLVELGREVRAVLPSLFYLPYEGDEEKILVGDDASDMVDKEPEGIIYGLKKEIHRPGKNDAVSVVSQ